MTMINLYDYIDNYAKYMNIFHRFLIAIVWREFIEYRPDVYSEPILRFILGLLVAKLWPMLFMLYFRGSYSTTYIPIMWALGSISIPGSSSIT